MKSNKSLVVMVALVVLLAAVAVAPSFAQDNSPLTTPALPADNAVKIQPECASMIPANTLPGGGVAVSVQLGSDQSGQMVASIYSIDPWTSQGTCVIYLTASELAKLPATPAQNMLVEKVGNVAVYKLTTGEIQVSAGPDANFKVEDVVFNGFPATNYHHDSYQLPQPQ